MLKLQNIIKIYGIKENQVHALKGIDLQFRKAEFVSILGPSGCGKTTLLNIIGGLDRYTEGDLVIDGKSTKNFNDRDWDTYRNNKIGFVFQSYNLIPHQTVLSNVELALTISGVSKKESSKRALEALKKVGLEDQAKKLPNQLSGGQMQRVAIARALVNNPEIILADEPTGALDSNTSIQVMEILKEVAKDRLVIMVTHNGELADSYSTRIIKLLDGELVGDTNPYTSTDNAVSEEIEEEPTKKAKSKKQKRASMSFFTAIGLSFKNLLTKKTRTILTSFAGSIGIISIALVLALSNGVQAYITNMQTSTLSSYPISISATALDMESFNEALEGGTGKRQEIVEKIYSAELINKLTGLMKINNLSQEYVNYLETNVSKEDCYDIMYDYGFEMSEYIYSKTDFSVITNGTTVAEIKKVVPVDETVNTIAKMFDGMMSGIGIEGLTTDFVRSYIPTFSELPDSTDLLNAQYDLVDGGKWATEKNELVLVINEDDEISDITLALLGFDSCVVDTSGVFTFGSNGELPLESVLGHKFYFATNNQKYDADNKIRLYDSDESAGLELQEMTIVGVARAKDTIDSGAGMLKSGLTYSSKLTEYVHAQNLTSNIVAQAIANGGEITTKIQSFSLVPGAPDTEKQKTFLSLGGSQTPLQINLYAKDFDSKENVKKVLNNWNDLYANDTAKQVTYSDTMAMLFDMLTTLVDIISYVLVAFTAISLIVSSIMIGIITYISVVERTKEIGVLRSLGASKNDVSNVFNAETIMIGLTSGVFGILFAGIVCIIANLIVSKYGIAQIAILSPISALVLIGISVLLTLIAGLIPARLAAKKDPVTALRTE